MRWLHHLLRQGPVSCDLPSVPALGPYSSLLGGKSSEFGEAGVPMRELQAGLVVSICILYNAPGGVVNLLDGSLIDGLESDGKQPACAIARWPCSSTFKRPRISAAINAWKSATTWTQSTKSWAAHISAIEGGGRSVTGAELPLKGP